MEVHLKSPDCFKYFHNTEFLERFSICIYNIGERRANSELDQQQMATLANIKLADSFVCLSSVKEQNRFFVFSKAPRVESARNKQTNMKRVYST